MLRSVICGISIVLICSSLSCTNTCLIKSDPPGAHVTVDNEYWGNTPLNVQFLGCSIIVEVSKGGYKTQVKTLHGGTKIAHFELEPALPDESRVATPVQQQQQDQQQQMMGPTIVIGGQTATGQDAIQVKEWGVVSFQSVPSGAEVYIENQLIGNTPISNLRFQAGSHNVTMKLAGYKPWVNQIMVFAGGQQTIKATLEK